MKKFKARVKELREKAGVTAPLKAKKKEAPKKEASKKEEKKKEEAPKKKEGPFIRPDWFNVKVGSVFK